MLRAEVSASYQELSEDVERVSENPTDEREGEMEVHEDASSVILPDSELGTAAPSLRFSKTCLKNVFSVILLFIYLLLMAVAVFLVYQTISDFREKLKHPVMSVSYKEVSLYDAPGIAFYPGKAQLLSCKHHYYDHILPLINPGQPGDIECTTQRINYTDPFTNQTMKYALVVQGPRDVKKKELVFLQFHLNGTDQDFSAIDYLLFSSFQEFINSPEKAEFMKDCESSYSSWKFSGGFRTWVKMSLVKTKEEDGSETVEFKQETSVVNYIDRRTNPSDQLFFVVFEWKDPFIQTVQDIITANPWNTIALLCDSGGALQEVVQAGVFLQEDTVKTKNPYLGIRAELLNPDSQKSETGL
ncbi:proton-activated chloride channel isoform X1 [Falco naumanni]|uniref:proton-activated chloride channel isoform X1 n=2 Tax=Falco naumanni TaxID=148594 RepID=UPI001ADE5219|nr:proton-activated chloride channel isoform X1 [Falco naumanni]